MSPQKEPSSVLDASFSSARDLFKGNSNKFEEKDEQGRKRASYKFPETEREADEVEHSLADELSKLTVTEHERVLFDIHGISQNEDEDPPDLSAKLEELENYLRNFPQKKKSAYERALYINEAYVRNRYSSNVLAK